ncbi:hypothetical protein Hanom_Chr14g01253811 [Helianthus anomalus]
MYPEEHLKHFYLNDKEDKQEGQLSPVSSRIIQIRNQRSWKLMHNHVTNPVVSIEKISTVSYQGRVMGTYEQNKYTLVRVDGTPTTVTDGNLADDIHQLSLIKMKQIIDQEKGNTVHI